MATAGEGGATVRTTTSSYGGEGAGGKFRKKPVRRPSTPYDRPPTALRRNDGNGSWLTKLVVDPASKLISYGAHRLFASVFRKRLPAPPPPRTPEFNRGLSDGLPTAVPNNQYGEQEHAGGESSQAINSSSSIGISELEQLLRQKTFTRSEIDHLTELLRSRAGEVSLRGDGNRNEETAADFGRHHQSSGVPLEQNISEWGRSHEVVATPIFNSKASEDDVASPAELAKAYMGSRPSKVSPSMLGMRGQVSREDTGMLINMRFASKSPIMSLTTKTSVGLGAPENGFVTPRSRGRSALYSMSRSPYSRIHPTSTLKGSGIDHNGYAGVTMSSPSPYPVEHERQSEAKAMTLKRRSSVLDDEVGSVGPIRRIRQKSNLIAPRIPRAADGVGIDSDAVLVSSKQKLPLIGETKQVPKSVGESADNSAPSTSYAHVPSKSSEVAARILQHLEKMTPKEKSSESKLVALGKKSPFKLTPSMLRGQALRSMEDVGSSKLLLDVQDDHKLDNTPHAPLPDACDSISQEQGKIEEKGPRGTFAPSESLCPLINKDSSMSLRASWLSSGASDSAVKDSVTQPPQKKRAFRMSAQEDSLELDEDLHCNGLESRLFFEDKGTEKANLTESKLSPVEQPKLVKTTIQPEVKSPSGLTLSATSEPSSSSAVSVREGSNGTALPALEKPTLVAQSAVLPLSVAAFDKPREANNPPLFSFGPKAADKFPSLPSESSGGMSEPKPESSSSLVSVSATTGSVIKNGVSVKDANLNPLKDGDTNGKSDTVPSASNGPLVSSPFTGSFSPAAFKDTNQTPAAGPLSFTSSTNIENFVPTVTGNSTSAISGGSIFGSATNTSVLGGPVFKFGLSADASTSVTSSSTTSIPVGGDLKTKAEIGPSSGSSSSSLSNAVAFGSASSGNSTFGLNSSVSHSTESAPIFGSSSKSLVSGAGTVLQGAPFQSVSSASSPSLNVNSGASFASSLSGSQVFNSNTTFGFSSSASSSDTGAVVPGSGLASGAAVFGASSTAASDGSAVSSTSGATPSMPSFGFGGSSTSAVGSTSGSTLPVISFGSGSSASVAGISTSSFSSGTSGIFNFGGSSSSSSSSSSAINSVFSNSTTPNGTSGIFNFGGSSSSSSSSSSSAIISVSSNNTTTNVFGSSWQSPKSSIFTSASPSTGFSFGALSTSSAPTNAAPVMFNSSVAPSPSPLFPFTTSSASVLSAPAPSLTQPVFGNPTPGFSASPGNNDRMNAEDSMAEDPVQSTAPSVPVFGQSAVSPSPPGFVFGSTVPSQPNPFQFGGQQNQVAPQNPSSFQGSGSLEFNAGGSFSLGSGGGDKSGRKFVKINRNKNRKK